MFPYIIIGIKFQRFFKNVWMDRKSVKSWLRSNSTGKKSLNLQIGEDQKQKFRYQNWKLIYKFDKSLTKIIFTKTTKDIDEESEETELVRRVLTSNPNWRKIPESVDWRTSQIKILVAKTKKSNHISETSWWFLEIDLKTGENHKQKSCSPKHKFKLDEEKH